MTKIAMVHLVDAILKRIPVPYLPEAAAGMDALVDALAPTNPQEWKDAIAAAREPWQRIHDRATGSVTDSVGSISTGVTGGD